MKTFLTILITTFFVTPALAQEGKGELDGKGLECTSTIDPLRLGPSYYLFERGRVFHVHVPNKTPLTIERVHLHEYATYVDRIEWGSSRDWVLDRKTLKKTYTGHHTANCKVMTHKEIEAILQKQIEALKEKMKDNKI